MRPSLRIACWLGLLGLFLLLLVLVAAGSVDAFDRTVLLAAHRNSSPLLDRLALEVTALGSGPVVIVLAISAIGFLWPGPDHRRSALLVPALVGAGLLSQALKLAVQRPRPALFAWGVPYAGGGSFPSGHSTTAVVTYVALAFLMLRRMHDRRARFAICAVSTLLVLLVGWSRIHLGVHYPSDVVGGFLLGLLWIGLCIFVQERAERSSRAGEPR